jgi:hypothetical protein
MSLPEKEEEELWNKSSSGSGRVWNHVQRLTFVVSPKAAAELEKGLSSEMGVEPRCETRMKLDRRASIDSIGQQMALH